MRENVIRFHVAGWSNAYISTFFHGRPCERTVRDWVQRYSQAPLLGAPAPLPIQVLHQCCLPITYSRCGPSSVPCRRSANPAVHELLTGRLPSAATISRELTIRLGLTRKKLTHVSINRDEPNRVAFWLQGPTHPTRPGVHGVPVNRIVSLDEKTIKYGECLPKKSRSPAGTPALIRGPAPSSLLSHNAVLAVDTHVGCVAYLIYRGTLNQATFYSWVALQVGPASHLSCDTASWPDSLHFICPHRICGLCFFGCRAAAPPGPRRHGPPRRPGGHHSAHHTAAVQALFNANGHLFFNRFIHSPGFAPAEWGFSHAIAFAQHYSDWVRMLTTRRSSQRACALSRLST